MLDVQWRCDDDSDDDVAAATAAATAAAAAAAPGSDRQNRITNFKSFCQLE